MTAALLTPRVRFDKDEVAGALGDLGTDVPLLVALVATAHLDAASVCITFGLAQIATGLLYGIPMPVQPLKAMSAILLAHHVARGVLAGGGLVVGAAMLLLALTGALEWLSKIVPPVVIRGIQIGLALTLGWVATSKLIGSAGLPGVALAVPCALLVVLLRAKLPKVPASLVLVAIGVVYALATGFDTGLVGRALGFSLPRITVPTGPELLDGALTLALPQIALSLGNSVLATSRATHDLFPERAVSVRRIGITYGVLNLIVPLFGGMPVCHGCGGLVGFHTFGARTGGAPVIYGALWLGAGLFLASGFTDVAALLPTPILGVVLLFEALGLARLSLDLRGNWTAIAIAACIAAVVFVPYGYAIALVAGTGLAWAFRATRPVRAAA